MRCNRSGCPLKTQTLSNSSTEMPASDSMSMLDRLLHHANVVSTNGTQSCS
jgi:hypothetical protein